LSADKPASLNFKANLSSVHPTAKQEVVNINTISLKGKAPGYAERRTLDQIESWKNEYKHPELYDSNGT
jgi:alpha-L-fucosidase 2